MRRRGAAAHVPLLLLVALATACGAPRRPAPPPPAAFYWEARAPGGATLFLLGSVHVGDAGQELLLPPRVALDWVRAAQLVVEVDLTAVPDLERLEAVQRYGLLPPEQSLRDVVSDATWSALVPYLRAHGYPLDAASRMRPWLLVQLVTQLELANAGYDPDAGVDAWFLRRALDEDKPVAQLESLDEQLSLFGSLPASVEDALLQDMLQQTDHVRETTDAILWAWEHGDEAALLELLLGSRDDPRLAAFHQAVFVERNHRMAERLAALAADGADRFVVVGTGHLIGPESVPLLLAARGFAVRRHPDAYVRTAPPALPAPGPPAPDAVEEAPPSP